MLCKGLSIRSPQFGTHKILNVVGQDSSIGHSENYAL